MTPYEAVGLLYIATLTDIGLDLLEMKDIKKALPFVEGEDAEGALKEVMDWVDRRGYL